MGALRMKNQIIVTGLELRASGQSLEQYTLEWAAYWLQFPAARIRRHHVINADAALLSVYFDSSTWTGRS